MEWIEKMRDTFVGIDTMPLIYFIEKNKNYHPMLRPFFQAIDRGDFKAVTSTISLLEVLVHPLKKKDAQITNQYRDILLHSNKIDSVPLFPHIAEKAAQLRAEFNLRTPDAIQLATAICSNAKFFLSNDKRWPKLSEIDILILDELKTDMQ